MPLSRHKVPAIYLNRMSPYGFSVLPSIVHLPIRSRMFGRVPFINDGLHELAASSWHSPTITRRLVVSYTTFSPLPPTGNGGRSLLPKPTVTNSFYFRKWSSLCCPDFPPAALPFLQGWAADGSARTLFSDANLQYFPRKLDSAREKKRKICRLNTFKQACGKKLSHPLATEQSFPRRILHSLQPCETRLQKNKPHFRQPTPGN